ncbi:hypothetical protein DPMN_054528 [Dreissena polymorpha]|uniref:Uncharacterized protein n=1 Tax=Dreissena polymorpha TaxID=45954 RepID=A0A9D4CQR6_DREPO|nr:hypothetical protein DPMN_054528 [Dreissena polymorpha]
MHTASSKHTLGTDNSHNTATNQPNPQIAVNDSTVKHTPDYTYLISNVTDQLDEQTTENTDRQFAHLPDMQNTEVVSPHGIVSRTYQQPLMDDPSIIDITPTPREDNSLRTQQNQPVNT